MGVRNKLENTFLSLGLIFGLLFVFLIPPLQTADEDSHFKKSYMISSLHLFPEVNQDGIIGSYIPQSILDFESNHRFLMGNMDAKYTYKSLYFDTHLEVNKGAGVFAEYSTSGANPILFLPQSLGMFLLKITVDNPVFHWGDSISPANYIYAGRMFNLLFYLIACYFAIRIIPFMKTTLFLIALMPMTFSLAASLSYDAIIISTILLFVAVLFRLCFDSGVPKVTKRDLYTFIVFSILLIQFKQVYYPLMLLVWLIPLSKFQDQKEKIRWFFIILASGIASYVLWSIFMKLLLAGGSSTTVSHALDQVKFILGSPMEYARILVHSLLEGAKFYFIGFVGNLGWLDTNFPYLFIFMYYFVLIASVLLDRVKPGIQVSMRNKGIIFLMGLLIIVLIETALYVIWTSVDGIGGVGAPVISGVQSRYFLPISLTLLIIAKNNLLSRSKYAGRISDTLEAVVPSFVIFSMILTTIILLLRYWIPVL
ncbi:DUF2142 domain-containing protein [Paenibacillus sp. sgz500958]|uniref:DUF2142 domain-containing protein n=1 Tax=Paenibacillus sp. sgz500958 TaxID=3242475 RepID=UPI0036D3B9C4